MRWRVLGTSSLFMPKSSGVNAKVKRGNFERKSLTPSHHVSFDLLSAALFFCLTSPVSTKQHERKIPGNDSYLLC